MWEVLQNFLTPLGEHAQNIADSNAHPAYARPLATLVATSRPHGCLNAPAPETTNALEHGCCIAKVLE